MYRLNTVGIPVLPRNAGSQQAEGAGGCQQWSPITKGTKVPKGETCIVLCGPSDSLQAETRCIAFAAFVRAHVRWYGITDTHQTPIELSRVVCFVREADVKRRFAQEAKLF